MIFLSSKQPAFILKSLVIFLLALSFISCKKITSDTTKTPPVIPITPIPPDLTTRVKSSVSGFVTNENSIAVKNAIVTFGGNITITDQYGFFELKNVQVVKEAAFVSIEQPGYFKGVKTFIAAEGKSAFFRIKLIRKTNEGYIEAATGGKVYLASGMIVDVPGNSIVNNATNAVYNGVISVAAHWINPKDNDLPLTMPGDLRGLDSLGEIKTLTTFGMVAVELTGSGGELLKISNGKKATLTIPLPAGIVANAPSTIPLWYFDETNGLWKQQGTAVRSGNNYIGEVSHFSFWNCDLGEAYSKFNCTLINAAGNPLANVGVKLSEVSNPQNVRWGFTDSSGYVSGTIPANTQLLLEVFTGYNCTAPVYTQTFTSSTSNSSLGSITINGLHMVTVTGNVINCSGAAVTDGFVIMQKDNSNYRYYVSNTGAFTFNTLICDNDAYVNLVAVDATNFQAGYYPNVHLTPGNNAIGALKTCVNTGSSEEFIKYNIDGTNYSVVSPVDTFTQFFLDPIMNRNFIKATILNSQLPFPEVAFAFYNPGIEAGSTQMLDEFYCPQLKQNESITGSFPIYISEYGPVGQYIAGSFSADLKVFPGTDPMRKLVCSFRVRRRE